MTKDEAGLKHGAPIMLAAIKDIENRPSRAENSGTSIRTGQHVSTRAVNKFIGGSEWSHALMCYALMGGKSSFSSDVFWFVFPHDLV